MTSRTLLLDLMNDWMNQYSEVTYWKQLKLGTRYVTVDVQLIDTNKNFVVNVTFSGPGPKL